jgi:hypothetical protein
MKNIHLLLAGESYLSLNCSYRDSAIGTQVGKPYWTYSKDWKHHMSVTDASVRPHNIYITSDEEIKEGDWFLDDNNSIGQSYKLSHVQFANPKKIILTTDFDKQPRVQAIDDEFLEWFVKNPTCEYVKVTEHLDAGFSYGYKIIFPKEEPKLQCKDCNDNLTDCTCIEDTVDMKQETLEEFIQRQLSLGKYQDQESAIKYSILAGAKWQQERMYSEEEVIKILIEYDYSKINDGKLNSVGMIKEWFKQFKNK